MRMKERKIEINQIAKPKVNGKLLLHPSSKLLKMKIEFVLRENTEC